MTQHTTDMGCNSYCIDPLSPRDALKHHLTSLKTDLIPLQLGVLELKFPLNWLTNTWQFSLIFHPLKIIFIHYNSRLVVDEDDNVKSGLKGLSGSDAYLINPYNTEIFLYKPWKPKGSSQFKKHHKCLSYLCLLHLITYVKGLRSL